MLGVVPVTVSTSGISTYAAIEAGSMPSIV